ncbi:hypothetical protein RND71_001365 [Anisodus tanguticus]|uniref:Uncharacterized protein n=1 Tax=Anisodus tanguticus TaxID=243964 RepID=A0AAE1T1B9_9SOLA|nr:hypothetical protein RND71_001365 [Anisodus tanguticus]
MEKISLANSRWPLKQEICRGVSLPANETALRIRTAVDVGYLAAQILKKPKLLTSTLEELKLEVDVEIMRPTIANGSLRHKWESSVVLSEEEVKVAMYEVYSCYQIATKMATEVIQVGASTTGQ